jgi:L-Lysine epsilon oxidase N-terminal
MHDQLDVASRSRRPKRCDGQALFCIGLARMRKGEQMSERAPTGETTIVRAAIYPAIVIARVGDSESEYFLAPEVADPPPRRQAFTVTRPAH